LLPFTVGAQALEQDLRAALGRRAPRHSVALPTDLELERHRHPRLPLADELTNPVADALDPAVQRVGHRVEERGFPRARRPADDEDVKLCEVELGSVAEGCEPLELQSERTHLLALQ